MASVKQQLSDLEALIKACGYTLRYERGHFRAGYCIVNERRVIVVNKFFDTRARLQKLTELLVSVELTTDLELEPTQQALYDRLRSCSEHKSAHAST